jgi:hypothetical protein
MGKDTKSIAIEYADIFKKPTGAAMAHRCRPFALVTSATATLEKLICRRSSH